MVNRWKLFLIGMLTLLAPGAAAGQDGLEAGFAFAAVRQGRGDYAEMRLQQVLCEIPADDAAYPDLLARFDGARSRHLAYAGVLLRYMEARRPSRRLRRAIVAAARDADRTMEEFDGAVREARVRVKGIPFYQLMPLVAMTDASGLVRSLYRSGGLDPAMMRTALSPPHWNDVAQVRANLDCTRL